MNALVRSRSERVVCCLIVAAAFLSLASVYHPRTGWGVNSRLALVFAVVDLRSFSIDAYHAQPGIETGDKAYYEGHFYSDKIFGVSLLAVPVYAAMRGVGARFDWRPSFHQCNYVLRLFAVSLPAALSVGLLWLLFLRLGAPRRASIVGVAIAFWGSLWFGFSSTFFPYAPGIAALMLALLLLVDGPSSRRRSAAVGFLCGFAVLCDMIFGLMVVGLIGVFFARQASDAGADPGPCTTPRASAGRLGRRLVEHGSIGAVGGLVPLSLFAAYSISIFGSLSIPYEYEYVREFRTYMAEGFMGITAPNPVALWYLTLHPYRGLLFWSPWAVLAIAGLVVAARGQGARRWVGGLGIYAVVAYFVFNPSYYMWWGGWSMGPRFLLPIFVVLPLGLAEWLRPEHHGGWRIAVYATGAVAIALSLPLSILDPEVPMLNDARLLLDVEWRTELVVPQFDLLSRFYSWSLYARDDGSLRLWSVLSVGLCVAWPVGLLWLAASRFAETGASDRLQPAPAP